VAISVLAVLLIMGWGLPLLARATNCGGNSAAISVCKTCVINLKLAVEDDSRPFSIYDLAPSNKTEIATISKNPWIAGSKLYVRTNVVFNSQPRQLMVVCDTIYDNVPQPTIWNAYRKNPAHAVAYSDCSVGLISPEEFKKLNLTEFIEAGKLITNNIARANGNAHL
jgi:hypothetical protein